MGSEMRVSRDPASFSVPGGANHLDQLVRQTRMHHMHLSMVADQKAAMLLTVSSVVLTLTTQYLQDAALRWAAALLIACCLVTVCLAALAVMPKLRLGRNAPRPPSARMRNRLFFGYFAHMPYGEWLAEMEEVMSTPDRTYEAQLREVYELGVYLQVEKYRYVQWGYAVFMVGLVLSAVLWTVVAFS